MLRGWWRPFLPTALPGATARGWLMAAGGAWIGISLTGLITAAVFGSDWRTPLLMVPLAASSVILFALPASPLARPWAIVVGHVLSALVGTLVAHQVANLVLASGLAVALSIVVMAATRALHPPGGSTALLGVIGGPAVSAAGYHYAFLPVGVNALLLVVLGALFHRWVSRHPYPHVHRATVPAPDFEILAEDIDAAVKRYGETLDIDREDVERLVREVERLAQLRRRA